MAHAEYVKNTFNNNGIIKQGNTGLLFGDCCHGVWERGLTDLVGPVGGCWEEY